MILIRPLLCHLLLCHLLLGLLLGGAPLAAEETAPPTFSHQRGHYEADLALVLDCPTPEAVVHYTTDGSWPDASSPVADGSIPIAAGSPRISLFPLPKIPA